MGKMKFSNYAIALSTKCNLNCSYCYILRENPPVLHMSKKTLNKSIQWVEKTHENNFTIAFEYGEPLLDFSFIKKVISSLRKSNPDMKVIIITNGLYLSDDKIQWISKNRISLRISIDGNEMLNRYRCDSKKYRSIINNALNAKKNLEKLRIIFSIHPYNVDKSFSGLERLVNYGFDRITIGLVDNGIPILKKNKLYSYIYNHLKMFIFAAKKYFSNTNNKVYVRPPFFFDFFFNKKIKISKCFDPFRCGAMNNFIFISPLGELYPCPRFYAKFGHKNKFFNMGNIFEGFNNEKVSKFLNDIKIEKKVDIYENQKFLELKNILKLSSDEAYKLLSECPFHNFIETRNLYSFPKENLLFFLEYFREMKKLKYIFKENPYDIKKLEKYFQICKKEFNTLS